MFPDARVLIGTREQRSMALALYRQYVRNGGVATCRGYFEPRNPIELPQFTFRHLEYDRLVRLYRDLFGEESVLVLPYEDLRRDPQQFARSVCRLVEVDPVEVESLDARPINAALGDATMAIKRVANKMFVRTSLSPGARYYVRNHEQRFERLDRWIPGPVNATVQERWATVVADSIDGAVDDRFRASNTRLAGLIGRNLASLGYRTEH